MSDKPQKRRHKWWRDQWQQQRCQQVRRYLLLSWVCFGASALNADAASFPDMLQDPLDTRPPVLDTGRVLPGDDVPVTCSAKQDLTQPLALSDAVDLALCNNPQIRVAWASIKIQAAALGEARAAYLPTLSGTVSPLHTSTHYPDMPNADTSTQGRTVSGALTWRIFDFGGRAANRDAANALLLAAMAQHDATLQKTLNATVSAYFEALTAQAIMRARTKARELADHTLAATQRREALGAAARNDTLQARTAQAKSQLAEQRARGDLAKATAVLVYTLGLPQQSPVMLADQDATVDAQYVGQSMKDLSEWQDAARAQHPAIVAAREQLVAAQNKIISARSDGLPTLDFGANYYQNGYPNQGLQTTRSATKTIGLTLTIPFFEGFSRTYKIRGAEAQAEQTEAQLRDVEHQILGDVVKAYADAQSSLANLAASETLQRAAQEALTSSQNRYERGAADILELLSVQSALVDAEQEGRVRIFV